jgi:hypothetical protein
MDNKTPFDRSLFIPIFIGFFSILGICLVLLATRLSAARGNIQDTTTATSLKYQYLATEPGVVLPTEVPTEEPATAAPTSDFGLPTPTQFTDISTVPSTLIILSTSVSTSVSTKTPTRFVQVAATNTPTPSATAQFLNVTYDDTDFKFLYTGNWVSQSGVSDTYQNTLHISNAIGDAVQLSFVGQKINIAYQAGPSLGAIAIKIDDKDYALDQSANTTVISGWESPVLVLSSHLVTITHISGGSINLDSIAVLDISTPTPTITPTQP